VIRLFGDADGGFSQALVQGANVSDFARKHIAAGDFVSGFNDVITMTMTAPDR